MEIDKEKKTLLLMKEIAKIFVKNNNKWMSAKNIHDILKEYYRIGNFNISKEHGESGHIGSMLQKYTDLGYFLKTNNGEFIYQLVNNISKLQKLGINVPVPIDSNFLDKSEPNTVIFTVKHDTINFNLEEAVLKVNLYGEFDCVLECKNNSYIKPDDIVFLIKTDYRQGVIGFGKIIRINTKLLNAELKFTMLSIIPILSYDDLATHCINIPHKSCAFVNPNIKNKLYQRFLTKNEIFSKKEIDYIPHSMTKCKKGEA